MLKVGPEVPDVFQYIKLPAASEKEILPDVEDHGLFELKNQVIVASSSSVITVELLAFILVA